MQNQLKYPTYLRFRKVISQKCKGRNKTVVEVIEREAKGLGFEGANIKGVVLKVRYEVQLAICFTMAFSLYL